MVNVICLKKPTLILVCLSVLFAFGCKKDKKQFEDPKTLPVVTTMQYYMYDGKTYTDGPHYYNQFILSNLGVPNSVILINGHNFSQDFKETKVLFNNISVTAMAGDSTQIIVMIPDNVTSGPVTLTINTNGKTIVHPTKFTVETPNPQISGVSIESGMVGAKVIIYGSDFSTTRANNKVTVNGVSASVDSASVSAVYITVPATSGTGKLILTTHDVALTYKNDFKTIPSTFTILNPGTTGFGPQNLALDAAGNTYGTIDNTVYKISSNGISTVLAKIPASADAVPYIAGCAVDPSGNVFISSPYVVVPSRSSIIINGPAKIYKVTPDGTLSVFAGKDYTGQVDGQGTNAQFWGPKNLVFDASGNLYVNDQTSIRKITPDGLVSTFANITSVMAMAVDARTGSLYVTEPSGGDSMGFSARIRMITPGGVISTPVINPMQGALPGGLFPDIKQFYQSAVHMVVDASGDLFVAVGTNLYKIKNSAITNTYLNPTNGGIIGLMLDSTGKIYLTLPEIADKASRSDKFLIYKVTP